MTRLALYGVVVVAAFCFAGQAAAGDVDQEYLAMGQDIAASDIALPDELLSGIHGKGAEAQRLQAESSVAVILWDERDGASTRRTASTASGNTNLQTVSVTVSWK
ncbi:MAG TPA: hypothetical protein PLH03_01175 [Methylophilaceae bacterium]|nr:hypothetical protein [Methylophilaceae bacterium]